MLFNVCFVDNSRLILELFLCVFSYTVRNSELSVFGVYFQIIQPALNVLINLVCPPPSISNKPPLLAQGQQSVSGQTSNGPSMEPRDRNAERNLSDRVVYMPSQSDLRERNVDSSLLDRGSSANTQLPCSTSQTPVPTPTSGLVGDRRISLGAGAGCAGLAAQLEQGYRQAREAVRANNGIKVLLHLLQPRIYSPPAALDCLRALACRVLLGLARDDTIAHILTKLQVNANLFILITLAYFKHKGYIALPWILLSNFSCRVVVFKIQGTLCLYL